jgi:hypothetical protein
MFVIAFIIMVALFGGIFLGARINQKHAADEAENVAHAKHLADVKKLIAELANEPGVKIEYNDRAETLHDDKRFMLVLPMLLVVAILIAFGETSVGQDIAAMILPPVQSVIAVNR